MSTLKQTERSKWGGLRFLDLALVVAATLATAELSRTAWDSAKGDIGGYAHSALAFWAGHPPLRVLPVEYPPGAVVPFALTLVPIGDPVLAFLLGATLAFVAGYLLFVRFSGRRAANRYAVYGLLGAQGTLLDRYDLFPALLTLGALWLSQRRRFTLAYALLAGGVALKLYPAILIPLVAIAQWRALGEAGTVPPVAKRLAAVAGGLVTCATLIALSTALPMLLSADGLSALHYVLSRPVQIESLQGTLVWVGTLLGFPAHIAWTFGSQNYVGALATALPGSALLVLLGGYGWVLFRLHRGDISVAWAFLSVLCLLVLTSKVFSAQYTVWLLPIAAEAGGYEALWLAVAALTTLEYPLLFPFSNGVPPASEAMRFAVAVALRNVVFMVLTVLLLVRRDASLSLMRDDVFLHRGDDVRGSGGTRFDVAGEECGSGGGKRGEDDGGGEPARERSQQPPGAERTQGD